MQETKINKRILLIISAVLLITTNAVTYMMLLSKNEAWKTAIKKSDGLDAHIVVDALTDYVYYDGDTISCNQTVKHYSRSGKMLGSNNLADVLKGDKVVMMLSTNSCSTCTKDEIEQQMKLSKVIGRENLVVIADYAMHKQSSWTKLLDYEGYYESEVEHLGLKGSPTRETPVVMLTHDGRVNTCFIVGPWTTKFTGHFHKYLTEYFKGEK